MKIYNYFIVAALSMGAIQSAQSSSWPTGVEDNVTVTTGQRFYIPVLANDFGEGLSLQEVNATTVALGSVQMDSSRTALYYTSKAGFTGQDSFWYAFRDNQGRTNSTQVFLNVIASSSSSLSRPSSPTAAVTQNNNYKGWPTANMDTVEVSKNASITIPVLNNDSGDRLLLTKVNDWSVNGGRASIENNAVVYSPKKNYVGQDSFWYNFSDAQGRTNSAEVKVTITGHSTTASLMTASPTLTYSNRTSSGSGQGAVLISMHADFLKNQHFVWGEVGGTQSMTVAQAAPVGSTQLQVSNGFTLKDGQLITYLSSDGQYYNVATSQRSGNTIYLKTALPAPIAQWGEVWNFYDNGSHPNAIGYYALADFALRNNDVSALNFGKHVMLGDSWFSAPGVQARLTEKLPNAQIANVSVGGQTAANLLERFDRQVTPQQPDVVWVIAGTNDYYQGVSVDAYQAAMTRLVEKINAIGATAIVFDSSVAPLNSGSDAMTQTSHQYARALADLPNL